ncbi:unnamed protein product [Clavelina lepadiformis]|uniref:Uncharacterized protein n=1 Tax=Clavelina lepadiformis TaxID=159417 RepID=A0ABP0FK36_CLALP
MQQESKNALMELKMIGYFRKKDVVSSPWGKATSRECRDIRQGSAAMFTTTSVISLKVSPKSFKIFVVLSFEV